MPLNMIWKLQYVVSVFLDSQDSFFGIVPSFWNRFQFSQIVSILKGEGGVYKGWNSQLAQWGAAIIPIVQRAPRNFEYIYITRETNTLCDIMSIQIAL